METNYEKYRGKCKESCEELIKNNSNLTLVRGYYHEPLWNAKEQHFWCVDENGIIHDPTRKQFPSGGIPGFYEEFDGYVSCEQCGKSIHESKMIACGNYPVCSNSCACKLVGIA